MNSYSVVPAIIPGDLQIKGNLSVSGPNFLLGRLGTRYRIQEIGDNQFVETANLDHLLTVQDDPTRTSQTRWLLPGATAFQLATEAPGTPGVDTFALILTGTAFQVVAQELRVGAAAPYSRVIASPSYSGVSSYNIASDGATRDDATRAGFQQVFDGSIKQWTNKVIDSAGNSVIAAVRRLFWQDFTDRHFTGVTGAQTVASKTIFGGELGASGSILVRISGSVVTSASGNVQLNIVFGGNAKALLVLPSGTTAGYWAEALISNNNNIATNTIAVSAGYGNSYFAQSPAQLTVDTTVNQTLMVQVIPSDTASAIDVRGIEAEFITQNAAL